MRLAAANYPGELEELLREGGGRAASLLLGEVSKVLRLVAECQVTECQVAKCQISLKFLSTSWLSVRWLCANLLSAK